jgi:uncharacterized membrane protein
MDHPVELIIAGFGGQGRAEEVRNELQIFRERDIIRVWNVALIVSDKDGKIDIQERAEKKGARRSTGIGAIAGGIIGAVVGGPIGGIVLGAGAGALAGKAADFGFDDDELKEIGEMMGPDSSTIVGVVEKEWAPDLVEYLEDAGARVKHRELQDDDVDKVSIEPSSGGASDFG